MITERLSRDDINLNEMILYIYGILLISNCRYDMTTIGATTILSLRLLEQTLII